MPEGIRLSGAVILANDLSASEGFYRDLFELDVEMASTEAVLLTGRAGEHLVLRALPRAAHATATRGVQYLVWMARDAEDLDRCKNTLKGRGAFVSTTSNQDMNILEGRDPDLVPVIVIHRPAPGARMTSFPLRVYAY